MPSLVSCSVSFKHKNASSLTSRSLHNTRPASLTHYKEPVQWKAGRACLKVSVPFHAKPARKPVNTPKFLSAIAQVHQ